jgi:molybdopterin molybdotransferase
MTGPEIDGGTGYIGFGEAVAIVRNNVRPVGVAALPLSACPGYVSAGGARARVDSPPLDSSLKDGFAVKSTDVANASPGHAVELKLAGSVFAGGKFEGKLRSGETVKICTGAAIPAEADAVVPAEFCDELGDRVRFMAGTGRGRNIAHRGEDVRVGMEVVRKGQILLPAGLAFAATAGIDRLQVYRKPRFAVVSVGDELVEPGQPMIERGIYASNSVNIGAWLSLFSIPFVTATTRDDVECIKRELVDLSREADVIITCGGAMHGERDLVVGVLDELGWTMMFRHVRMGPGKGTSFGMWQDKPVFCLSGGPGSNAISFLQFALPAALSMAGLTDSQPPTVQARLTRDVRSRNRGWTEFREARLAREAVGQLAVTPVSDASRPRSMVEADCLLCKPEGVESLRRDQIVTVQIIVPSPGWGFRFPSDLAAPFDTSSQ